MAKLTRAQEHDLQRAIYDLERGIAYLRHPKTAVCYRHDYPATTTSAYSSHDGKTSLSPFASTMVRISSAFIMH